MSWILLPDGQQIVQWILLPSGLALLITAADPATQMGRRTGVVDPSTQWAGQIGVVDPGGAAT